MSKDDLEKQGFLTSDEDKKTGNKVNDVITPLKDIKLFNLPYNSACFVDNT